MMAEIAQSNAEIRAAMPPIINGEIPQEILNKMELLQWN
jgi:hypothetical protein